MKILKYYKITITIIFTFLLSINVFAQQRLIDSLDAKIQADSKKSVDPSINLPILERLYKLSAMAEPYLALEYAGQALQIYTDNNDIAGCAEWCSKIADIYFEQKVYYLAMQNYFEAYTLYKQANLSDPTAQALINIGNTYFIQNVDDVALVYFNDAENMFRKTNNLKGIAQAQNRIAMVQLGMYQYDQASDLFKKSLAIAEKLKDQELIADTYCSMAAVFDQTEEYDSEIKYLNMAVTKYRISGNRPKQARCNYNLGEVFFKIEKYDKAYVEFLRSLNIYKALNLKLGVAGVYNKMGRISFFQADYSDAISKASQALSLADENQGLVEKAEALLLLSDIEDKLGQADKAFEHLHRFTIVKDSLYEQKKSESFSELQVSLSTKEKEKELAVAEQEIKRKESMMIVAGIIAALVIVFSIYVIRSNRRVKKVNNLLTIQKKEIGIQKDIVMKANEEIRLRNDEIETINHDITSSINYAARIQTATLSSTDFIKEHFIDGFVYFHPRQVVSGDFYWFSEVKNTQTQSQVANKEKDFTSKLIVSVVDCTGHGVPGAFMSMLGDAFLNQIVNLQRITDPSQILNELHKLIRKTLQQETGENNDGMDAAICVIDKSAKTLEYAGAKNPLIYIQNGVAQKINGDFYSIGGMQREDVRVFKKHVVDITAPTSFYIYSDGYQDQFGGEHGRKFMAKHFREYLVENADLPFADQSKLLFKTFNNWRGDINQMDDTTIVGVKLS